MLLLISPQYFTVNQQALTTNVFMNTNAQNETPDTIQEKALYEHRQLIITLESHNIKYILYENYNEETPDAVFANNWLSVHSDLKKLFIYPMYLQNRKQEVRFDIIMDILERYPSMEICDLRASKEILEGTGSMVFDHSTNTIYAAVSQRTNERLVKHVAESIRHKLITFYTEYRNKPIYHTNVMMAIGKSWVVICTQVIDMDDLPDVLKHLGSTGKQLIVISVSQMEAYCGNILEIYDAEGTPYTIMSSRAKKAFHPAQLERLGNIIEVPLDTIETYGGGGVRCCLTEIE